MASVRKSDWDRGEILGYRCGSGVLTLVRILEMFHGSGTHQTVCCRWLRWVGDELPTEAIIQSQAKRPLGPRTRVFMVVPPRRRKIDAVARIIRTGVVVVPPGTIPEMGSDRATGACSWLTVDEYLSTHHTTERELTAPRSAADSTETTRSAPGVVTKRGRGE